MRRTAIALLLVGLAVAVGCRKGAKTSLAEKADPKSGAPDAPGATAKGTFTVGKATTYVTGPKDESGRIDYAAALNERLSKGVTPENNANLLIWKALGPTPGGPTGTPPGYFEKLGIPAPPVTGEYFVTLRKYAEQHPDAGGPEAAADALAKLGQKPWKNTDNPTLAAWLTANEKPLALVVEATGRTHYYSPLVPTRTARGSSGLISSLLPAVQATRELAGALAARAMLSAGRGQNAAAWADLLTCHRLARLVGRGGTLIEGLVGMSIEQIACRADVAFLEHARPDAKQLQGCLAGLAALPPVPGVVEKIDLCERFAFLDHVMQTDRQGLAYLTGMGEDGEVAGRLVEDGMLSGIDWDPALEAANLWFDRIAAAVRENDRAERVRKLDQLDGELRALRPNATGYGRFKQFVNEGMDPAKAKGRAAGEVLISLLLPAARKVDDAADRAAQTFENTRVAFALAWYQRENGRYPDRLDALALEYLPAAPKDRFSGGDPVYRPNASGYLLYSVGVNGKDDGGRGYDSQPPGDDLVVRVPAAK